MNIYWHLKGVSQVTNPVLPFVNALIRLLFVNTVGYWLAQINYKEILWLNHTQLMMLGEKDQN